MDFRFLSFVLINFNEEFNKGQDRGLEILDFRFPSFVLIKFNKEFNKGKDLDSKIQKSKKSKNYRGAPKVLDFLDLLCVFGVFFCGFSRCLVLENFENPKNTLCFWIFRFLLKNPRKALCFLDFSIKNHRKKCVFCGSFD